MTRDIGVGVAIFVWRDGKCITNRRMGTHGKDTVSIPGGHLEKGESWEECAQRELMEEVGCSAKNIRLLAVTNDLFESGAHYVTIWLEGDWASGNPASQEPSVITDVAWRSIDELPDNLFEPCWTNLRNAVPDMFRNTHLELRHG